MGLLCLHIILLGNKSRVFLGGLRGMRHNNEAEPRETPLDADHQLF